jgi:hypothetical protein
MYVIWTMDNNHWIMMASPIGERSGVVPRHPPDMLIRIIQHSSTGVQIFQIVSDFPGESPNDAPRRVFLVIALSLESSFFLKFIHHSVRLPQCKRCCCNLASRGSRVRVRIVRNDRNREGTINRNKPALDRRVKHQVKSPPHTRVTGTGTRRCLEV